MKRAFRIRKCGLPGVPCWRWECTLCHPPAHGCRYGQDAFERIVQISMKRHFRVRSCHHAWVLRHRGGTA